VRRDDFIAAYASAKLKAIKGIPRIASDHRPANRGANSANTPKVISARPARRPLNFLKGIALL
jgi:hypothetical protein